MVCYDRTIFEILESEGAKKSKYWEISFKFVQKLYQFDIFMVRKPTKYLHGAWFFKRKMYNFDPYIVLLAISTDIPVLLMTGLVIQGHVCSRLMYTMRSCIQIHTWTSLQLLSAVNISIHIRMQASAWCSHHTEIRRIWIRSFRHC